MTDPLDEVFSFVERHYWRLQAGDVLIRCLEEGRTAPLERVVEVLVLDGPHNLGALQEILDEVNLRRQQVEDDLRQVLRDLRRQLSRFGLPFEVEQPAAAAAALRRLLSLTEQDDDPSAELTRILRNSREVMSSLDAHLRLLMDIEQLLIDWLWGLAYHSAHDRSLGGPPRAWVH